MKARSGGVEAAVVGDRRTREKLTKVLFVCRNVNETAPLELLPNVVETRVVALTSERWAGSC